MRTVQDTNRVDSVCEIDAGLRSVSVCIQNKLQKFGCMDPQKLKLFYYGLKMTTNRIAHDILVLSNLI